MLKQNKLKNKNVSLHSSLKMLKVIVLALSFLASSIINANTAADKTLGAWQNPDMGLVLDFVSDLSDVENDKLTTQGLNIRSAEFELSSDIDPFSRMVGNFNFSKEGVELHEAYILFHSLPGFLELKGGYLLANFGRWNTMHTHAMPFVSEPRIFKEYFGGHFMSSGLELSWLTPLDHYLELTGGVYNGIKGHSHDNDPVNSAFASEADRIAAEQGLEKHGSHWHAPDGSIVTEDDLVSTNGPKQKTGIENLGLRDLAYSGRAKTNFEIGDDWSVDIGSSIVYQNIYSYSQQVSGQKYSKMIVGSDITFFWHPLTRNLYRNINFGIEYLGNKEDYERVSGSNILKDKLYRHGFISHIAYKHNVAWQFGLYSELFQASQKEIFWKKKSGIFATYNFSHFQFARIEFNRYKSSAYLKPVHRVLIQYDALIGYHTHGTKR